MKYICKVVRGAGRGKKLGFPTINLLSKKPLYFTGVFAGSLEILGAVHKGVIFIGKSETFAEKEQTVEIHLFNFNQNTEEELEVRLFVGEKIREIQKFSSGDELKKAILEDCKVAEKLLRI